MGLRSGTTADNKDLIVPSMAIIKAGKSKFQCAPRLEQENENSVVPHQQQ